MALHDHSAQRLDSHAAREPGSRSDQHPAGRRRSGDASERPITGLLFLVGIFLNSYEYGLTALLGLLVATLAAYLLGADRTLIGNGLFGFNGVLTGITLSVFLQ